VAPLEGRSAAALLRGEAEWVRPPDDVLGWELFGRRAILKSEWKLTWASPPYGPGEWQLFDVVRDPGEQVDLSQDAPEKRAELLAEWEAWAEQNGVILPRQDTSYARVVARE
jgi:arylsulfatase